MRDLDAALQQLAEGRRLVSGAHTTLRRIATEIGRAGDANGLRELAERLPPDPPKLAVPAYAQVSYMSLRAQFEEAADWIASGEFRPDELRRLDFNR